MSSDNDLESVKNALLRRNRNDLLYVSYFFTTIACLSFVIFLLISCLAWFPVYWNDNQKICDVNNNTLNEKYKCASSCEKCVQLGLGYVKCNDLWEKFSAMNPETCRTNPSSDTCPDDKQICDNGYQCCALGGFPSQCYKYVNNSKCFMRCRVEHIISLLIGTVWQDFNFGTDYETAKEFQSRYSFGHSYTCWYIDQKYTFSAPVPNLLAMIFSLIFAGIFLISLVCALLSYRAYKKKIANI